MLALVLWVSPVLIWLLTPTDGPPSTTHERRMPMPKPVSGLAVCALLITLLTAVVGAALVAADASDGDLRSAATWIEALATTATFAAAVVAGAFAYGAYRLETERENAYRDRLRAEQASKVAAWYGTQEREVLVDGVPMAKVPDHGVWLQNGSAVPVTDIRCDITHLGLHKGADAPTPEPIGGVPMFVLPPTPQALFVPFRGQIADRFNEVNNQYDLETGDAIRVDVDLVFTDSAGIRWTRFADGGLTGG